MHTRMYCMYSMYATPSVCMYGGGCDWGGGGVRMRCALLLAHALCTQAKSMKGMYFLMT